MNDLISFIITIPLASELGEVISISVSFNLLKHLRMTFKLIIVFFSSIVSG